MYMRHNVTDVRMVGSSTSCERQHGTSDDVTAVFPPLRVGAIYLSDAGTVSIEGETTFTNNNAGTDGGEWTQGSAFP